MSNSAPAATAELSPIAQDYLKAIWSACEWGGRPATVKALAARFEVRAATASDTIRRLAADGLVAHERYGSITLTDVGQRHALAMVRRHRLIETFLARVLGYSPEEVHDEAEQLEHSVSELFLDRVDALLKHPVSDPHGDPIPTKAGEISFPAGALQLKAAGPGRFRIARLSDHDSARLAHLAAGGLSPGVEVTVLRDDEFSPITLVTDAGAELAVSDYTAEAIFVAPVGA